MAITCQDGFMKSVNIFYCRCRFQISSMYFMNYNLGYNLLRTIIYLKRCVYRIQYRGFTTKNNNNKEKKKKKPQKIAIYSFRKRKTVGFVKQIAKGGNVNRSHCYCECVTPRVIF